MSRSWIGLGLLAAVVGGALLINWLGGLDGLKRAVPAAQEPVALTIYYGGEKSRFLRNPDVRRLLEAEHRITLDARKAGSIEMVTSLSTAGVQCLWPSNEVAVALARRSGKQIVSDRNIFNSPIVFYAWEEAATALARAGVVRQRDDGFWAADIGKLAALITEGARWREDLKVDIYGPVRVLSTDPTKSNSGAIWSALLALGLNNGAPPTAEQADALAPKLAAYFRSLGFMEDSSGDIFENFLKQGVGARPIIVGYENQLVEFLIENADFADQVADRIRVIYPDPTIYASHPLIALDTRCARLADALSDPKTQDLAWRSHGFRTGVIGVQNDPADLGAARLPERIGAVAPMPNAEAMTRILGALGG